MWERLISASINTDSINVLFLHTAQFKQYLRVFFFGLFFNHSWYLNVLKFLFLSLFFPLLLVSCSTAFIGLFLLIPLAAL